MDLSTDESETAPGERVTEVREQVTAARTRVAALLPSFVRQNLTAKLLLMLFLGVLVSGVAVFFLYGSIDAGLNEQVTAQVESDTSLHAQWYDEWLQASTSEGFIAWLNKCTHFCCVPGYKQAADAARFGGEDGVYCQCHQSVYDPFSIVQTLFIARPRPD